MGRATQPKIITPGVIAAELQVPLHRVLHVLATRQHIQPAGRAGTLRVFDREAVALVRLELADMEHKRKLRRRAGR